MTDFILSRTDRMLSNGLYPLHVFDGVKSPHKLRAHDLRSRSSNILACPVDADLVASIVARLRTKGLMYVQSLYESDHQLIALDRSNVVE